MPGRPSEKGFLAAFRHAFAIPAEEPLTEQERELLSGLARKVVERNLTAPAIMVLEGARPLNYVGAHVLLFFKPVISLVFPPERCDQVAALLEKRCSLEVLARMVEQYDAEKRDGAAARNQESGAQK